MAKITKRGLAVVILYVLMSVTLAEMTQRINASKSWEKPLLTCWFNHSFLVVLWPVLAIQAKIGEDGGTSSRIRCIVDRLTAEWFRTSPEKGVYWHFTAFMVFFSFLLYSASGAWIEALQHASVTDIQALQKLIPVFTIIFAYFLLGERISWVKVLAVAIALSGVAVLSLSATRGDEDSRSMDVWGVLFGCSSAVAYALYAVLVKKAFGDALDVDASILIMFLVGVTTVFPLCLCIPLNDVTGLESSAIPGSWNLFGVLCLNAFVAVLTNVFSLSAIALNGPTFTTIFGTAQIAIAAVVDYLLYNEVLSTGEWIGCFCVMIGCILTVIEGVLYADTDNGYQQALSNDSVVNDPSMKSEMLEVVSVVSL